MKRLMGRGEPMEKTFKEVIEAFNSLKSKFQAGEISRQEFIDKLKRLRIKDDQGRFWMIGARTGKWYYYDGKDWVQSEAPSQKKKKAICIYCGFENTIEAEACARCGGNLGEESPLCPKCGAKLQKPYFNCPKCGASQVEGEGIEGAVSGIASRKEGKRTIFVLRSVHPSSAFIFGGVFGLLTGIIVGAFAGATEYFKTYLGFLPKALTELGILLGALIYGLLGGVVGFALFGSLVFLIADILNFLLSLVGGIKFTVHRAVAKESEESWEE
jgi:ribosomal protein L40E